MTEAPDPIDGPGLRALLVDKNVKKPRAKWDLSDAALRELARGISALACGHQEPIQPSNFTEAFLDTDTQYAFDTLYEGLTRRRDALLQARKGWQGPAPDRATAALIKRCTELIAKIDAALSALDDVRPIVNPTKWPKPGASWRDYAVKLARWFILLWKECQGNGKIGLATNGPVVGFVWAVVPLITGESPRRENVAVFLKAHRTELPVAEHKG